MPVPVQRGENRSSVSIPGASAARGAGGSQVLRNDGGPLGWVQDRFVLLVPANAVVLVCVVAEQLDDLAAARWLAVQPARLDPIAYMCRSCLWFHGELIQPFGRDDRIGVSR